MTDARRLEIILSGPVNPDALLDDQEVAALLKCSVEQLRHGRTTQGRYRRRQGDGTGKTRTKDLPPHRVLFGGRMVRYRYGDVLRWLEGGDVSTAVSEAGA